MGRSPWHLDVAVHSHTFACAQVSKTVPHTQTHSTSVFWAAQSSQITRHMKQRAEAQMLLLAGFPEAQSSRNSPLIPEKLLSAGPDGGY